MVQVTDIMAAAMGPTMVAADTTQPTLTAITAAVTRQHTMAADTMAGLMSAACIARHTPTIRAPTIVPGITVGDFRGKKERATTSRPSFFDEQRVSRSVDFMHHRAGGG